MNPSQHLDSTRERPSFKAWLPLLLVLGFAGLWAYLFYFQESLPPFEDAAMLLRYAEHLAQGHGIVWNVGEAPVDGATDFFFMVMVAGLARLGMEVQTAARLLTLLAHALTIVLVYRIHLRWRSPVSTDGICAATLSALVVATGPGLNYCEAQFGTPVFALAGLLTFERFMRLLAEGYSTSNAYLFAGLGLITSLIRPEGVIFILAMIGCLLWRLDSKQRWSMLKAFGLMYVVPGLVYFIWHWAYFGHPLPNPFYVKGGGSLHFASLKASCIALLKMGNVVLPLLLFALIKTESRRKIWPYLLPIATFAFAWILMSNAMNFSFRFQYLLMPILWVVWRPALEFLNVSPKGILQGSRLLVVVALALLIVGFQAYTYALQPRIHQDGRADLGTALQPWANKGYTMAVTEAGNLPLYSKWKTIDLWGLNDSHIAHEGIIDRAYFVQNEPALVMIHDYWSPLKPKLRPEERWAEMTDSLDLFLQDCDYELVACWGRTDDNTHFYYIQKSIPDFVALKALITDFQYRWYEDGKLANEYD